MEDWGDTGVKWGSDWKVKKIIEEEKRSSLYLPNFQRRFIWSTEAQTKLITSLLAGVPVGGILLFKSLRRAFAFRVLGHILTSSTMHTVNKDNAGKCLFLLDGQQRISALKTICSDPFSEENVRFIKEEKGFKKIIGDWRDLLEKTPSRLRYRWFIDLNKPISFKEEDEQNIFCNKDLKLVRDDTLVPSDYFDYIKCERITPNSNFSPKHSLFKIKERAIQRKWIPLWLLLGNTKEQQALEEIVEGIAVQFKGDIQMVTGEKLEDGAPYDWKSSIISFLKSRICNATIPDITLEKNEDQLGVGIAVFEAINRGGMRLSTYDLISARMANEDTLTSLTEHIKTTLTKNTVLSESIDDKGIKTWNPFHENIGLWDNTDDMPTPAFQKTFLSCLGVECFLKRKVHPYQNLRLDVSKEKSLLGLTADEINRAWDDLVQTFVKVFQFLHLRCGLIGINKLQYDLMILPLYTVFRDLPIDSRLLQRCEYWYWVALFSGRYREAQNKNSIADCKSLYQFCSEEVENPFKEWEDEVLQVSGYSDFQNLGRSLDSGNYNHGLDSVILQYILSRGVQDFDRNRITPWAVGRGELKMPHEAHLIPATSKGRGRGEGDDPLNSPLNKTYLLPETNLSMGTNTIQFFEFDEKRKSHILPDNFADLIEFYLKSKSEENLQAFLSARYDRILHDVQDRLASLLDV